MKWDLADPTSEAPRAPVPLSHREGAAFMATGVALIVHMLFDVPLWASAPTSITMAVVVLAAAARRYPGARADARDVLRVGAVSAIVALGAYDGARLLLSTALDFEVTPFAAFVHFGRGLIGSSASEGAHWIAGAAFHVANGITFGIAYTIWAGRRGVVAGVIFGLALEAVMLGLYPAWLQIPNLREFASMSAVGHVAYGGALGAMSRRGLERLTPDGKP